MRDGDMQQAICHQADPSAKASAWDLGATTNLLEQHVHILFKFVLYCASGGAGASATSLAAMVQPTS